MVLAIEVSDLRKSYGRVKALNGLSFRVSTGEIHGLIGPNGTGKTTTLKILVGLLKPDSRVARVMGIDVIKNGVYICRMYEVAKALMIKYATYLLEALFVVAVIDSVLSSNLTYLLLPLASLSTVVLASFIIY